MKSMQKWRLSTAVLALALPYTAVARTTLPPGSTVSDSAGTCTAPVTQSELTRCAHEDFLGANADYANAYAALSASLATSQRDLARKMQKAWLGYRTAACAFESGAAQGGSVQQQLNWLCAARMTRERAVQLSRMATCREGDVTCNRRAP